MQTNYTKILLDFQSIPQHKRTKTFMEIAGYPHYENVCSNILKFYLDPTNEHGLNDLVLNSLLQSVGDAEEFMLNSDFEGIKIDREYLTLSGKRIDLVLQTNDYVIGIENKIFSSLYNDLADYKNTIEKLCIESKEPIYIVLSLNNLTTEKNLKENSFVNITYEQLFENIKLAIGRYLKSSNLNYTNYLLDFIKSIENLTPKTMENKELFTFFKDNAETIQELTNSFNEYKKSLYQKVYQLKETIPQNEFAPLVDREWIFDRRCLVHDYIIELKYKVAIDTYIGINGWEIQLFGRNEDSRSFLFNVMCKSNDFLPQPLKKYVQRNERLIYYKNTDTDTDILVVTDALKDLLKRIENYKKRTEDNTL